MEAAVRAAIDELSPPSPPPAAVGSVVVFRGLSIFPAAPALGLGCCMAGTGLDWSARRPPAPRLTDGLLTMWPGRAAGRAAAA